ncbi:uncharacterized protein O3C94_008459 [Discoglossus pictus]
MKPKIKEFDKLNELSEYETLCNKLNENIDTFKRDIKERSGLFSCSPYPGKFPEVPDPACSVVVRSPELFAEYIRGSLEIRGITAPAELQAQKSTAGSQRVKHIVLCKEPQKGGKGVPDIPTMLRIFFACNCVRRTLRDCDQGSAGMAMTHFFLLPLWRGVGWDRWDSSFPYNWTTPWFYQDVVKFVREHQLQSIKPDLWTPKVIYKLLCSNDIMESVDGLPAKTAETVWDNVSSKRLTNRHKDTAWMAIQGGLPLRQFMHARGLCRYRHCPRGCAAEETSLHVFWQCPFAQNLLDSLADELKDCVPRRYLTYHSVLYGLFHGTHSIGAIKHAWRIMCCVKDALWFARNRLILKRITVTTQDCRRLVLSLLRDYSILDSPEEEA